MSLLVKPNIHAAGAIITALAHNQNEDKLYEALNGVAITTNLLTKFSGADPVYDIDQLGAGLIARFKLVGVSKLEIQNSGKLKSLVVTGTAPIDVDSTTVCPNLNADKVDGLDASAFVASTSKVVWNHAVYIDDPSTQTGVNATGANFYVPDGALSFILNKVKAVYNFGTPTADTVINIRNGVTVLGTITLLSTLVAGSKVEITINQTFAINSRLNCLVVSAGGHRRVTVQFEGTQQIIP